MSGTNCDCDGIPSDYADDLEARTGRRVRATNLGAGGDTTADLLELLRSDGATREAVRRSDVVLVVIGANDLVPQWEQWSASSCDDTCYRPAVGDMQNRLDGVLDTVHRLHPDRASVLVATYWNVFTDGEVARSAGGQKQLDWSNDVTLAADRAIATSARDHGATTVDLYRLFKQDGAADPTKLLADDGDHPNSAGVRLIAQAFADAWTP